MGSVRKNVTPLLENANIMLYYSPLRYPGGKGKILDFVKNIYQHNDFTQGTYIEPYAGGAGVALGLLLEQYVNKIIINDLDIFIFYFWKTIAHNTDYLIKKIHDVKIDMREWQKQKDIYNDYENFLPEEIAFAFFFLNRVNHSGVINGGIIGGLKQNGNYRINSRFNKQNLIKRIELIGKQASKIEITNLDALDLLKKINKKNIKDTFIYMDPPYYKKGKMLYKNFYIDKDHVDIEEVVREIELPILITYDNADAIRNIYNNYNHREFSLHYSLNNKNKKIATELMIYKNLEIPTLPAII